MSHLPLLATLSTFAPGTLVASALSSGMIGTIALLILFFFLIVLALCVLLLVALWKIYQKAGVPGWATLVPFYNNVKLLEIVGKPQWWVVLMFVPVANIVVWILVARRLAGVFGKGTGFTLGLIFLPFIFFPILAFGNAPYVNIYPPSPPMSEAVKWSIVAGMIFLLVQSFLFKFPGSTTHLTPVPLTVLSEGSSYATDGMYVYYNDRPIHAADPESFRVVGDYATDDHAAYYEGLVLHSVQRPETFKVFADTGYATDGTTVYYTGAPVPGADVETFVTEVDPSGKYEYDAKDIHNYYQYGQIVTLSKSKK